MDGLQQRHRRISLFYYVKEEKEEKCANDGNWANRLDSTTNHIHHRMVFVVLIEYYANKYKLNADIFVHF